VIKKIALTVLLLLISSCAFAYENNYVEGEVIVVIDDSKFAYSAKSTFSTNTYSEEMDLMAESFAESTGLVSLGTFSEISRISGNNIIHLRSETKSTEQLMQELADNPDVKSAQPNYKRRILNEPKTPVSYLSAFGNSQILPNDPHFGEQWGFRNIGMPQVWEHSTGSESICVAVIDTGIDYNHQDLNANMARDSYGNYGRHFTQGTQNGNPMDYEESHGTHVAGIIGAVGNNGIGVAGINWNIKLLAVKVFTRSDAYDSDFIAGINYVLSEKSKGLNIKVANMSLGGWDYPLPDDSPLGSAIRSLSDAGIICVFAAGNSGENLSNPSQALNKGKRVYPACFRFANTITVGAINNGDQKISLSNYGREWVDMAAPGDRIYSTLMKDRYGTLSGTSMAAPHVAGAAALLFAAFPNESASQIKQRLIKGAKSVGGSQELWGNGLLDVTNAFGIETIPEKEEPLTSVKITGGGDIHVGRSSLLNHTKHPSNANGYFEYSWKVSDESIAKVSGRNNTAAEIIGLSGGKITITLTVTQTLQSGTKITRSDSIEISIGTPSSSSGGCNSGLLIASLLLVLPILRRKN